MPPKAVPTTRVFSPKSAACLWQCTTILSSTSAGVPKSLLIYSDISLSTGIAGGFSSSHCHNDGTLTPMSGTTHCCVQNPSKRIFFPLAVTQLQFLHRRAIDASFSWAISLDFRRIAVHHSKVKSPLQPAAKNQDVFRE